ncbi:hypothetical protein BEH94_08545 [Candidatus Altiarchaeales archaeon WOR_SM1_SCG]|nr:hypothetical protein BEH94_08545 [Candidatus Altiarchaeales archaeon WOR_SM1_SCG]
MITRKFLHKETVLNIKVDIDIIDELIEEVLFQRKQLEHYIQKNPYFYCSYEPVEVEKNAPGIVKRMAEAGKLCGVGPMAAVAGTISELCARRGIELGAVKILIENGGDICCCGSEFIIKIFSGDAGISNKIGFKVKPGEILGICTSSQTVGHSVSFGESDAVVAISKNTSVADAAATAVGNAVKGEVAESVQKGIELAKKLPVEGVMIIRGEYIGTYGKLPEIVEIE